MGPYRTKRKIKVLCGVEYSDSKQLFHVSKTIPEATLIAKATHFELSPEKKVYAFRLASEFQEEHEAPNAPFKEKSSKIRFKQDRCFTGMSMPVFPLLDEEM